MIVHLHKQKGHFSLNYVDDFLGIEYISNVWRSHADLVELLKNLGVGRSESKSVPPDQIVEFIGNLVNAAELTIGVTPQRKIQVLRELEKWRTRVTCSRQQLESLIGKLQFMSNCIKPGRLFISRMLMEMKAMCRGKYYKINQELRKDIKWWYLFLPGFNGTCIMWLLDVAEVDSEFAVDACMVGSGGISAQEYFRTEFPREFRNQEHKITHLELWSVIIAVRIWGSQMTGKIIRVRSDNEAVACIINTGHSQDLLLQKMLRELTWWLSIYQFKIKSVHLSGALNRLPDILSHWHEGPGVRNEFYRRGGDKMSRKIVHKDFFKYTHDW